MVVRHTCANAICVNPKHLILGTQKDNIQDMIEQGNAYLLPSKITPEDLLEIKYLYHSGWSVKDVAKKYNVHPKTALRYKIKCEQ